MQQQHRARRHGPRQSPPLCGPLRKKHLIGLDSWGGVGGWGEKKKSGGGIWGVGGAE